MRRSCCLNNGFRLVLSSSCIRYSIFQSEVVQSTQSRLISSQSVIFMYILEVAYLIHVLLICHNLYLQFDYDSRRLILGLLYVCCALCVAMADPGTTVVRFEHWFPPHVLLSIRIRYGTYLSGSGTVDTE